MVKNQPVSENVSKFINMVQSNSIFPFYTVSPQFRHWKFLFSTAVQSSLPCPYKPEPAPEFLSEPWHGHQHVDILFQHVRNRFTRIHWLATVVEHHYYRRRLPFFLHCTITISNLQHSSSKPLTWKSDQKLLYPYHLDYLNIFFNIILIFHIFHIHCSMNILLHLQEW